MRVAQALMALSVAAHAAEAIALAASRSRGVVAFCGPTGNGKNTLARRVVASQPQAIVHWRGELRMAEDISSALARAESELVIAVVRSGACRRRAWRASSPPPTNIATSLAVRHVSLLRSSSSSASTLSNGEGRFRMADLSPVRSASLSELPSMRSCSLVRCRNTRSTPS